MNAPLLPHFLAPATPPAVLAERAHAPGGGEALETTQHHVWESRYGTILIDVVGDTVYVNGSRVEPAQL